MKTRILYFALAAAALFSLGACNQKEDGPSGDRVPLKISASIGGYATKALDTSFEEGDVVGLFASAPLDLVNEKLTWSGNALVPGQTLYWPLGSEETADFRAYYPYNQELKALEGQIPFQVKLDQSQYANYTASDLMFAAARASAKDEKVNLVFDHKLSKIAVKVENNTGEAIREVLFAVQFTTALVDAANGVVAEAVASENIDVMHAYVSGDSFYAIVPPQKTPVQVAITTVGGKTFTFEAKEVEFLSGKQSRGTVTLNSVPEGDKVEFSLEIYPWEEGGNIRFTDSEIGERSGYDVYLINTRERIHMTETNPGEFFYNFPNYNGEQFYVLNESNNYIYGCTLKMPQDIGEWPCVNGGNFQLNGYTGDLNIWFYPDEGILKYDPVYPDWKSIGEGEIVSGMFSAYYGFMPEVAKAKIYEDVRHPGMYTVYSPFVECGVQNEYIDFYSEIVIDARNPEKVYMKPVQWLYDLKAGRSFTLFSDVVENGEDGEPYTINNYGYIKDGIIRLGYLTARYDDGSETVFNADKAFQLVLPGYKREPVFGLLVENVYPYNGNDGIVYEHFTITPYPDVENIKYSVYRGKLTSIEAEALADEVKQSGTPIEFIPGEVFEFGVPMDQTGVYTVFFYADSPNLAPGYWRYEYRYFSVTVDGFYTSEIGIASLKQHDWFPEKAASLHVDAPDAYSINVRAISTAAAENLSTDDYYSYAKAAEIKSGSYDMFSGHSGQDLVLTGLEPETEYLVIVAADNAITGGQMVSSAKFTTAKAPETWDTVGTGTWVDNSFMTGGYRNNVTILKEPGKERYRAVQPYADFWETLDPSSALADTYIGYSTDFDFYFVEDADKTYIFYAPWRNGRKEVNMAVEGTETAYLDFFFYELGVKNPSRNRFTKNNVAAAEGVYNIAPYVRLHDTNSFYAWYDFTDLIVLAMPGYSYEDALKPAAAPKPRNYVEIPADMPAPVIGEHKLQPFKRLPIKLGKPIVKPVNN